MDLLLMSLSASAGLSPVVTAMAGIVAKSPAMTTSRRKAGMVPAHLFVAPVVATIDVGSRYRPVVGVSS